MVLLERVIQSLNCVVNCVQHILLKISVLRTYRYHCSRLGPVKRINKLVDVILIVVTLVRQRCSYAEQHIV